MKNSIYWKCSCNKKISLVKALFDNDAVEDDGELNGCQGDRGWLFTNIYCKCGRALMITFEVTREFEKVKGKVLKETIKIPIPETDQGGEVE